MNFQDQLTELAAKQQAEFEKKTKEISVLQWLADNDLLMPGVKAPLVYAHKNYVSVWYSYWPNSKDNVTPDQWYTRVAERLELLPLFFGKSNSRTVHIGTERAVAKVKEEDRRAIGTWYISGAAKFDSKIVFCATLPAGVIGDAPVTLQFAAHSSNQYFKLPLRRVEVLGPFGRVCDYSTEFDGTGPYAGCYVGGKDGGYFYSKDAAAPVEQAPWWPQS